MGSDDELYVKLCLRSDDSYTFVIHFLFEVTYMSKYTKF